jgi:sugar/nucleoside kinase (ribokinase family)
VTLGTEGVLRGEAVADAPGVPARVDTTGAGDAETFGAVGPTSMVVASDLSEGS